MDKKVIRGTAAVLLAGVGVGVAVLIGLTWTEDPSLEQVTADAAEATRDEGLQVQRTETLLGTATDKAKETPPARNEEWGTLGAMTDAGPASGLIGTKDTLGAKGIAYGMGGLGTRGSGLGGGGSASGYGSGSGSFGARGSVGGSASARSTGASSGLSRSELGPGVAGVQESSPLGVSGFVQSGRDRLSTFAVDVDTGSYTLTRGLLRRGQLPRAEQVRVEEFVNVMDYDLAPPTSGQVPFAVAAEGAPHPTAANHALLRVALKGEVPAVEERANRLTFLIDTSCSMTEELPLVKQSLHVLVDHAGPEDSIAIATYAGSTTTVLQPTPTSRRALIHQAIDGLSNGGGTAMGSGMELAYDMADRAYVAGAENRVVVMSDGDANIGPTTHQQILASIKGYAGKGITMSAVGFGGANYSDAMMEQLADNGDGNYVYIDGLPEAQRVFGEGLASTLQTIARDVKIQVAFDPDAVLAWRLVGYENRDVADQDFRNDAVDGGEIGSGHEVTALYELVLADELPERIGHVYLRAKPPGPDAPAQEWTVPVTRQQLRAEWGDASADLTLASGAALFAEKLRGSPFVEELSWEALQALIAPLPRSRQVVELRELMGRAQRLSTPEPTHASHVQAGIVPTLAVSSGQDPMEVVRRHMPRLRYCYQRQLVMEPDLSGSVLVVVDIDATGQVVAARTPAGSLQSPRVSSCLTGVSRRMRFAAGAPQSFRFSMDFVP